MSPLTGCTANAECVCAVVPMMRSNVSCGGERHETYEHIDLIWKRTDAARGTIQRTRTFCSAAAVEADAGLRADVGEGKAAEGTCCRGVLSPAEAMLRLCVTDRNTTSA